MTYNPANGQYKPILVFGGMGSGKTSGVMTPAALGASRISKLFMEATAERVLVAAHHCREDGPVYIINPMGVFEKEFRAASLRLA